MSLMSFEQGERIISLLEALSNANPVSGASVLPSIPMEDYDVYPNVIVPAMGRYERIEYTPRKLNLFYDRFSEALQDPNNEDRIHVPANTTAIKTAPKDCICCTGVMLDVLSIPNAKYNVTDWDNIYESFDDHDINIYPIDMWQNMNFGSIISGMSEEAIILVKQGKLSLLLQLDGEAFGVDEHQWIRKLSEAIIGHGLADAKIVLTCADLHIEQNYHGWSAMNKDITDRFQFRKVLPIDYFAYTYTEQFLQRTGRYEWGTHVPTTYEWSKKYTHTTIHESELIHSVPAATDKTVDFMCLNGASRPHRIAMVSELYRLGLQKNFISLLFRYQSTDSIAKDLQLTRYIRENYFKYDSQKDFFNTMFCQDRGRKTIKLDMDVATVSVDDRAFTSKHYMESYFSLVTETRFGISSGAIHGSGVGDACIPYNSPFMVTEKIYKPIANFHPFIVLGSAGTLAYLRDEGYETFPEMFNESYDMITDDKERFCAVSAEVEKWCNLSEEEKKFKYNSVREKIKYNHEKMIDKYITLRKRHINYYYCIGDMLI